MSSGDQDRPNEGIPEDHPPMDWQSASSPWQRPDADADETHVFGQPPRDAPWEGPSQAESVPPQAGEASQVPESGPEQTLPLFEPGAWPQQQTWPGQPTPWSAGQQAWPGQRPPWAADQQPWEAQQPATSQPPTWASSQQSWPAGQQPWPGNGPQWGGQQPPWGPPGGGGPGWNQPLINQPPPEPPRRHRGFGALAFILLAAILLGTLIYQLAYRSAGSWLPVPTSPSTTDQGNDHGAGAQPSSVPTPGASVSPHPVPVTQELQRGVVMVEGDVTNNSSAFGTGMVIRQDGVVLTNYHVVRDTTQINVTVVSTGNTYTATVIGHDATADVAVLRLAQASGLSTIATATSAPAVGDLAISVGNGGGQGHLLASAGMVLELNSSVSIGAVPEETNPAHVIKDVLQLNTGAVPGYSGGPTFNSANQVIGMTTAGNDNTSDPVSYAIPIGNALKVADQILRGDQSGTVRIGPRAYLGITPGTSGPLTVQAVAPDSPADTAGLRVGDLITQLDDNRAEDWTTLVNTLEMKDPGDPLSITWTRNGRTMQTTVTLATHTRN